MKSASIPAHRIELRIRQLAQLFNSMDPTPFRNRDLDPEAEAFIESWAQEFPPGGRFHITIHLEQPPQETDPDSLATAVGKFATGNFSTILRESLTIVGWVAMWRPLQIFLYDWWPLARRRRLYVSLSRAQVHVLPGN